MKTTEEIKLSKCYTCSRIRETIFKKSSKQYGRIIFWCKKKGHYPHQYDYNGCKDYRTPEEQKIISKKMTESYKKWEIKKKKEEKIKKRKQQLLERDFCKHCHHFVIEAFRTCPNLENRAIDNCNAFIDVTEKLLVDKIESKGW